MPATQFELLAWLRALGTAAVAFLLLADLAQARGTFVTEDWQRYMHFQAADPHATVIVDGTATVVGSTLTVAPTGAVRHRPAADGL